jgi:hypothetical protein
LTGANEKRTFTQLANKWIHLPASLYNLLADKINTLLYSAKVAPSARLIAVSPEAVQRLQQTLAVSHSQPPLTAAFSNQLLNAADQQLIDQIRRQTGLHGRNNVTRTKAYWTMYRSHPELHWALLAHMVSRNGGWNMTDLRGDLLPRLLTETQVESLFAFLERANGLIFQDAYPQLLLYAESKRLKRGLFHLLPHLQVSDFMKPIWKEFWHTRESSVLTIALIINEQNYIEKRIIQNKHYQQTVLSTVTFLLQSLMQLNHVVFPYQQDFASKPKLAGLILENFNDLTERIEFGKKLYALLFGLPSVQRGVVAFAEMAPHTGSRSDYWPDLFTSIRKAPPEPMFKERLNGCELVKGAEPLYSASLKDVWSDRPLGHIEQGDWFTGLKPATPLRYIQSVQVPFLFDMTSESCLGLNKMEVAILAGQSFGIEL